MFARRPLSARRAQAVIEQAQLVKAPDWSETRQWQVKAGEQVLVTIAPSYDGTSRSGRNGWRWRLQGALGWCIRPELTREKAAVAGLAAWQRRATGEENR